MSAQIIAFPTRTADRERLALVGGTLKVAVPITTRDSELDLLIQIGGKLLDNLNERELDRWLRRVDTFDRLTS